MSRDTKVYVGNLSSTTTRGDLEHEFDYYGRLINVWVAKSPPGFAYVEFEDGRDAEDAIKGLDGKELHGRRIRVERSHGNPRGRREEGFGRGGGARRSFHPSDRCYNCGETGHYAYDCDLYNNRRRSTTKYKSERRRRSYSRSRSRSPRRRRSRSASRSRSRSRRQRYSRSRSRSHEHKSRSRSYSRSKSRSREARSRSGSKPRNGRSRSRSHS